MTSQDKSTVQLTSEWRRGTLTRREFITRALALGLSLPVISQLLAACAPGAGPGGGALEKEVNVIAWAQEWEDAVKPFEDKNKVKVNLTFETDPLETTNKIKASPKTFDVVSYGPFDSPQIAAGVVQPMDKARLTSWKDMHPFFQKLFTDAWGEKPYQMTFYWGCTLLAYRTDLVKENLNSWSALWDPKYKGMVCVEDQATEIFGTMALASGLDLNDTSAAALAKARDTALKIIPNVKSFWSTGDDVKQWMASGEIAIAHIWDGTARMLLKEGTPLKIVYPTEGVRGWIDGPGLVADAPHPNAAYAWINHVMAPEAGAKMAEQFYYAPANVKSFDLLSKEVKDLVQADQVDEVLNKRFHLHKLKEDQFKTIGDWWTEIRAKTGS
jgi:spermidine/putrescine transport system substrate-binding protein